jgi:hypothetical protein
VVVDLLIVQWLRTHFFLDVSNNFPALGIHDVAIQAQVHAPANQQEIEDCVGRALLAGPCLTQGGPWLPPS